MVLTVQDGVPPELIEPAMDVAAAQSKQQRKRFLSKAATFNNMQVRVSLSCWRELRTALKDNLHYR